VDVVAELPVLWSMSTAQNFALGGVWQLYSLGCDEIVFGSECGDIEKLIRAADILESDEFHTAVSAKIQEGITFASARQQVAEELGCEKGLLESANDNLGIEYISAAKRLNLPISFRCVKRVGADHDSMEVKGGYVSASFLRERLRNGKIGFCERYMPDAIRGFLDEKHISDIKRLETAILATLRTRTLEELSRLPDVSEGIENKLFFSIRVATGLEELYNMVKTKRYTLARVRRLVLSAFLGLDNELFMTTPPYVRILGFSKKGLEHLRAVPSFIPRVTRANEIKELGDTALKVFETECRATDLYALSLTKPLECGSEYKSKLLKTECLL
jgi:predicted nucleotidyltransferase